MRSIERLVRLGLVSNEFFDKSLGRMGGFGFAARQVIKLFAAHASLGVEVVCLPGERLALPAGGERRIHGALAIECQGSGVRGALAWRQVLRGHAPDVLLTIDFRPSYLPILGAFPRTPAIIWIRDPRTPDDIRRVNSLTLPDGRPGIPFGIGSIDCRSLRWVDTAARVAGRPLHYGTVSAHLGANVEGTYGVRPKVLHLLPNIVPSPRVPLAKSSRPQVLFLGRLDPIKRPWLFFDLAARLPDVDFVVLGQLHGDEASSWRPDTGLPNVRHLGHLEGEEKDRALASAWVLVNTSVHEAVAFSFFEALAHRTPIVSCQDGGGLATKFGSYVGWAGGDGRDLLPAFEAALRRLIADQSLRERLGREGQAWVAGQHSASTFVRKFAELCRLSGIQGVGTLPPEIYADGLTV